MMRITLLLAACAFAFTAAGCGGSKSSSPGTTIGASGNQVAAKGQLSGEVGPGFTIEVKQNGKDAESLKAGTYALTVEDKSDQHNFHLIGPGIDQAVTDITFMGDRTVTVTLAKGTYTYQCDPHAANGMKGTFTVA